MAAILRNLHIITDCYYIFMCNTSFLWFSRSGNLFMMVSEWYDVIAIAELLVSPPSRHSDAAGGLTFYRRCSFLTVAPSHSTTGTRISTRIAALTPSMKKFLWLKIWWTSVKGHCHSNQFCGMKRRQVGMKRLYMKVEFAKSSWSLSSWMTNGV